MSTIVTPDTLATYLGTPVDDDRAQMLIDDAIAQALSIVTVGTVPESGATESNLPAGAASVIRPAVARIYLNPQGATSEVAGPYSVSRSANTGSLFSNAEIASLRRLAGRGGAFTIDMLPADALSRLPWWDVDLELSSSSSSSS